MNFKLQAEELRHQIDALILQYPELAEDDVLRSDMIEGETVTFELLAKLARKIGESKALAEGIGGYVEDLRGRAARFERRVEGLRSLIFKIMSTAGLPKAELPEATLSIRNGQPKVIITDETLLPDLYCRIKREPDKTLIKQRLQAGNLLPGAVLSNAEQVLSIRVK